MKNSLPELTVIREYLLGRLDEQNDLEAELSEQILSNDDLAELVESVEDEILEEYLDGTLNAADRKAVEGYFLRPLERQERLRFARLVRGYFDTTRNDVVIPAAAHWGLRLRTYWPAAALILLTGMGLTYFSSLRQKEALLEAQLKQQSAPSATMVQPEAVPAPAQSAVAVFTLVLGQTRASGTPMPQVQVTPSTKRVFVEIVLQNRAPMPYDLRLESNATNEVVWSARLSPLVSADGARLVFDIPEDRIKSGIYSFVVSSGAESDRSDYFKVIITK